MKKLIKEKLIRQISIGDGDFKFSKIPEEYRNDEYTFKFYDPRDYEEESYKCFLEVYTNIEETDEEYEDRIRRENDAKEFFKKRRYENYLKLKQEFEKE